MSKEQGGKSDDIPSSDHAGKSDDISTEVQDGMSDEVEEALGNSLDNAIDIDALVQEPAVAGECAALRRGVCVARAES